MRWTPGETIDSMERDAIEEALRYYNGNKTATAAALGITVRTVHKKLDEYATADKLKAEREEQIKKGREERNRLLNRNVFSPESLKAAEESLPVLPSKK